MEMTYLRFRSSECFITGSSERISIKFVIRGSTRRRANYVYAELLSDFVYRLNYRIAKASKFGIPFCHQVKEKERPENLGVGPPG